MAAYAVLSLRQVAKYDMTSEYIMVESLVKKICTEVSGNWVNVSVMYLIVKLITAFHLQVLIGHRARSTQCVSMPLAHILHSVYSTQMVYFVSDLFIASWRKESDLFSVTGCLIKGCSTIVYFHPHIWTDLIVLW